MATAWDKLEQLLTCAICLDRFRNPKMLPCQHSFCQEPCMEGLQDYARRQIKCPECRAEHRIPFQGIQTYPTNVTLQRFLELHQSITGEEPEPVPSMMERCGVCSEKSTVTKCSHCDKKVCPECKEAHIDILKREISRICHQVRRALNRLQDALSQTERSMERLNVNSVHIRDEIEEIVRRFVKDLKAQEDKMLKDLETYSQVESKNLAKLKDDLAIEYDFLKDNCDSVEKNIVDPEKNWNDVELCEVKYIFVKTLDFLRNFDADAADYTRGMKFLPSSELDTLRRNLVNFGELKLLTSEEANANVRASSPGLTGGSNSLSVPQQSMLMRSQSDHRLATQFARRDSRISDLTSQSRLNPGYSDSEKDPRDSNRATSPSNYSRSRRDDASRLGRYGMSDDGRDSTSRNRFLREADSYRSGWSRTDDDSFSSGPQFKSRFMRERGAELSGFDEFDYDPNAYLSRSVRFEEPSTTVPNSVPTPLVKVFDVPEAPRGCLSGIVKISDTAHYMERSHENEVRAKVEKERKEEESRSLPPPSSIPAYQSPQRPRPPSRQVSEDEIEKQKKMNQASAASSVTTNTNSSSLTNNTTSTFNSSTTTPSTIGLTSTTAPVNSYGSTITASNTQSSDSIRPITRRIGTFRDDEDSRSSSTHRSTSDNTSSTRRSDTNDLTSSLVDDNDDDLGESNLSRLGRRRRGSLTGEDSKESVTSSGRSSQVSATPASSASTATSGLRSVRAPLAKNLPIAEEEEDRDRDIARKRGPKSSLVNPTASSLGSSIGKQTDNRNKDDDFTQSKSKFGYAHGGNDWAVEEWDDDQDEEEEEEEVDEDEEDGEEEAEEEEEFIEEDEQEENDEDEEDAEEEGEEEEDNGNGNISQLVARPSTPEPLVLVPRRNYGLNIGSNVTSSGLRYHLNRSEIRGHNRLREQEQQNITPTQPEQYDKGRENGLPCSVADLLDRSAQVRRDSVELRHKFFEVDRPSSSHEHKPGNTRASSSSQMSGLSDQQSHHQSEMPGSSKSFLEDPTPQRKPVYRPSRYPLGRSEGGLDSAMRTSKLNRHSANTVNDKHETPSWSRSKPNRLSSHARSNINPITSTSGFDNHNLSTTTVKPKPLKKSSDRSYYHSPNYHSNPVTGRIISPALTSVNSGPLAASSASASTAASNALSSSSHNYDLSNSRLSRSKSSHLLGVYSSGHDGSDDDDDTSTPSAPTYRSRYAEANYGKEGRYQYRTRQQPKDREKSPSHDENSGNTGTTAWSQYLRNKYGSSRNSSASSTGSGSRAAGLSKSKSSHAVYSRNLSDSSDEEGNTNTSGPKGALSRKGSLDATETSSSTDGRRPSYGYNLPRSTYLQKRRMMFKIGTRGTEPGCFTWPRGIACGPDNSIVVADSSNHRVQVFDSTGRFLHEFGSYGSAEGEFDCLAGVAVNRIGQYIVSDRYNHRVQIFDPSGRFLRSFGCEGRIDGRFSYPWGITTDSLGFIYVCDKENHRIQVFQSDGTFVGKFGSIGNRPGLLEHPHYIAVSNTNRVIVSDSNNHRIQIFDVNGRSLSTFGCEGTEEGQFKFPRGIAVDDQGYIIVGDSGNNRIQIFNPDGTFLKAFGSWGSSEGEFKGLEGVAVSTTGNILVCDRENHRIQVF